MIPKTIHYCWFGKNKKNEIIIECIESWKKYCPDYEIVEWNEDNFDVNCIPYVKEAYKHRKWAFVSDYARLAIVYNYGGIYLDTDVLLKSNLDNLLNCECWLASNDVRYIATGLGFGAQKHNRLIKSLMDAYLHYTYPSGTNVTRDTIIVEKELPNWTKSDRTKEIDGTIIVGLKDYSKYAEHLYTYSWAESDVVKKREEVLKKNREISFYMKMLWKIKCFVRNPKIISYFDNKKDTKIEKIYTFFAYDFLDNGPIYFAKRLLNKIIK